MKACTLLFGFAAIPMMSFAAENAGRIARHTPAFVSAANDLGPEDGSNQVTVHVWLRTHNADSLRALVAQQYDPASANYHKWLTPEQFNAAFAPTPQEAATVQRFLEGQHLSVLSVGERNLYVKAQGSIADVQNAFHVQIHQFSVGGRTYRANTSDPMIEGPAGPLVASVGGMTNDSYQPQWVRPVDPDTGKPVPAVPLSAAPDGAFFSAGCFRPPQSVNFRNDGALPKAIYFGNRYGADITNTAPGTWAPCGYQPSDIQTAYNLKGLYPTLDGTGQTIVIVDAYGSPTIAHDAAVFSAAYGLPAPDLTIYQPGGPPASNPTDWAAETTLDVEWAHAVAPGAKLVLVEALTNSDSDLDAAILYAVTTPDPVTRQPPLGNVISNSWGDLEALRSPTVLTNTDTVLMAAVAQGISVNFSSGNYGDSYLFEGQTDVEHPASSVYATAIGGTSLALNRNKTMAFQTGWGNNFTLIADVLDAKGDNPPFVPPVRLGFYFGAGGGASRAFPKPAFQRSLPGSHRMLPDISYLADPFTGVEVICTGSSCFGIPSSSEYITVYGGTSLACPMFSALWAIANVKAISVTGHPLGQAAQLVYGLPAGAVTDVKPLVAASLFDVWGLITTHGGGTFEPPSLLVGPQTPTPFVSALYNRFDTSWWVLSFGTDSSLHTSIGWDNVTGVGTPNGLAFVNAVAH
jgi:subtilase family serine protease